MPEATVKRTLVKSPPELWAEISDADALARHLGEFGEIRITRTDPETTVAWEGDRARGTVEIEGSGWGTKVTLTAQPVETAAEPVKAPAAVVADPEPPVTEVEPVAAEAPAVVEVPSPAEEPVLVAAEAPEATTPEPPVADPAPTDPAPPVEEPKKPGFWARMFGRKPAAAEEAPVPEPATAQTAPAPEPVPAPAQAPVIPLRPAEPEPEPVAPPPAAVAPEPVVAPEPDAAPALDAVRTQEILNGVLNDLGAAHHRPFSR